MTTSTATYATGPATMRDENVGLLVGAWVAAIMFWPVGLVLAIVGKNKGDARFTGP